MLLRPSAVCANSNRVAAIDGTAHGCQGVDGMLTNRPDILIALLQETGQSRDGGGSGVRPQTAAGGGDAPLPAATRRLRRISRQLLVKQLAATSLAAAAGETAAMEDEWRCTSWKPPR